MLVSEWPLSLSPILSLSVHLSLGLSASVSLLRALSLSLSQIKCQCITLIFGVKLSPQGNKGNLFFI